MFSKTDAVFGKLEAHNQTWIGNYWFEALRQDIEINLVYNGESSPSEQEKEAFLNFKTESGKLFLAIEKALFHFLVTNTEHYRQQYDDVQDQEIFVPELKNSTEVWQHLEITRIELDSENYQSTCITIICDFKWDEEHGLDIDIHNKKIGISEGGIHWDTKEWRL